MYYTMYHEYVCMYFVQNMLKLSMLAYTAYLCACTFVQLYLLPLIIIAAEAVSCNPSLHNNYMTFNGQNHVKLMHFL